MTKVYLRRSGPDAPPLGGTTLMLFVRPEGPAEYSIPQGGRSNTPAGSAPGKQSLLPASSALVMTLPPPCVIVNVTALSLVTSTVTFATAISKFGLVLFGMVMVTLGSLAAAWSANAAMARKLRKR